MDNEINVLHALHGSLDERAHDKGAISRFLSDTSTNAWGSILYLYECINSRRCKIISLCNSLWVGQYKKRKTKAAAKYCQSLDTCVSNGATSGAIRH